MDIEKIYDLVALRIIVKSVEDCYAALGVIHNLWPPLPNRIKDYIAMPKPNNYRSLHTTVFCVDNRITEIQIRTEFMHQEAETGIAAHWAYQQVKQTDAYLKRKPIAVNFADQELDWVAQLRNWQKTYSNSKEFLDSLKIDFFRDRIFAITPRGEVIDLPLGATPIDFAYQVHTEIGDTCAGAKVNGKIVPLNHQLRSGDIVEILTQKNKKPSESWLSWVKTSMAKNNIRAAIKSKSTRLDRKEPEAAELRIAIEDRQGLLKEIADIISRSHVNIKSINTITNAKFPILKISCDITAREKIEKLRNLRI